MSPRKRVLAEFPQAHVIMRSYNIVRIILWPGGGHISEGRRRSAAWRQAAEAIDRAMAEARAKGLA